MWFMLFGDDPQVVELARIGQARLAGLPGLDLVPPEWLHLTTLIAGFCDEIAPEQMEEMACHARRLLARMPMVQVTVGRVFTIPGRSCSMRDRLRRWSRCCARFRRPREWLPGVRAGCTLTRGAHTSRWRTATQRVRRLR